MPESQGAGVKARPFHPAACAVQLSEAIRTNPKRREHCFWGDMMPLRAGRGSGSLGSQATWPLGLGAFGDSGASLGLEPLSALAALSFWGKSSPVPHCTLCSAALGSHSDQSQAQGTWLGGTGCLSEPWDSGSLGSQATSPLGLGAFGPSGA